MFDSYYEDGALTVPLTRFDNVNGLPLRSADLPVDFEVFVGDLDANHVLHAESDPGVDDIVITPTHAIPVWSGGQVVIAGTERRGPAGNGYLYEAQNGGTTGGSAPAFPEVLGATVDDNGITWKCTKRCVEPTNMKLAPTQGDLATAVAGAALSLGTQVVGGLAGAVSFWVRIEGVPDGVEGLNLSPTSNACVVDPV